MSTRVLADLWTANTGGAEAAFLVAFVLALIATVMLVIERAVPAALTALALAGVALGWALL